MCNHTKFGTGNDSPLWCLIIPQEFVFYETTYRFIEAAESKVVFTQIRTIPIILYTTLYKDSIAFGVKKTKQKKPFRNRNCFSQLKVHLLGFLMHPHQQMRLSCRWICCSCYEPYSTLPNWHVYRSMSMTSEKTIH